MRSLAICVAMLIAGCNLQHSSLTVDPAATQTLPQAKVGFTTKVVRSGELAGPADVPVGGTFQLIKYPASVGPLAAYVGSDPGDGKKHPAIVWITGGDNNSIGDVWTPSDRSDDQSASAFLQAGLVMMFPSQRGGNDNPGKREGFLGEVDDVLAATDYVAQLPYVDASRIYLGGHSTGGTLALLVAASTDRYKGVFSLGPVAGPIHYGGEFVYCNLSDAQEMKLRSPIQWLHAINCPTLVFEGANGGNWSSIRLMANQNRNAKVQFFKVPGHDHFSVIAPVAEKLSAQIVQGEVRVTEQDVQSWR